MKVSQASKRKRPDDPFQMRDQPKRKSLRSLLEELLDFEGGDFLFHFHHIAGAYNDVDLLECLDVSDRVKVHL